VEAVLYSANDAAKRARLSRCYLVRLCSRGLIPATRVMFRPGEIRFRTRTSKRNGTVRYREFQGFYVLEPRVVDSLVAFRAAGGHLNRGEFLSYLANESEGGDSTDAHVSG
jgi:hypothetical protein